MSYEQLQLFVRMCPATTKVNLYVDEDLGHLLSPLHSLDHLQELKLLACNFYSDRVDRLVREQGHRLTLLHLEHVDELDMSALSLIALCCPALEKLVFFSCDFVENFGSSPERFPEPPFRHLTHLVCVSESAPNVIEFLLVIYIYIDPVRKFVGVLTNLNIGDGREPEKRPVWLHRLVQRPDCLKRPRKVRLHRPFVKQPPTCV